MMTRPTPAKNITNPAIKGSSVPAPVLGRTVDVVRFVVLLVAEALGATTVVSAATGVMRLSHPRVVLFHLS